jgi:transposase InsO family protein
VAPGRRCWTFGGSSARCYRPKIVIVWRYLATVMDRHFRRLLGWALSADKGMEVVSRAVRSALRCRKPRPGTIFHSDQQLRSAIQHFIGFYNRYRLHSSLGYRSPIEFESSVH